MLVYSNGYQDFYISIRTIEDTYDAGTFICSTIISSPNGRTVMTMTMAAGTTFSSAAKTRASCLDWAKAWIDKNTAGRKR